MSLCSHCRIALRHTLRSQPTRHHTQFFSSQSTAGKILAKPTWSVRSLLASDEAPEEITPTQLHHLLRLSALPLPKSKAEEDSMIATLQSQLQFVRAVQRVDTEGVEPLRAIRDETEQGTKEITIGLDSLKETLAKETLVGHYKRPRRVKEQRVSEAEDWDALSTASRKAGKYFVVESAKKSED